MKQVCSFVDRRGLGVSYTLSVTCIVNQGAVGAKEGLGLFMERKISDVYFCKIRKRLRINGRKILRLLAFSDGRHIDDMESSILGSAILRRL